MTSLVCVIPFAGFYESVHSVELDRAAEQYLDTEDRGDANPELLDRFWRGDCCDWCAAHEEYSRQYAKRLADAVGATWEFSKLDSPRFYNFETDRIMVNVSAGEVQRWLSETNDAPLREIAARRHTSRSGFISFYDPDPFTWGPVETWEPEQLHTLLLAWIRSRPNDGAEDFADSVESNGQQIAEYYLMEEAAFNVVGEALTPKGTRLADIAYYLRERRTRSWRPHKAA